MSERTNALIAQGKTKALSVDMGTCGLILKKPMLSIPPEIRPAMLQVWLTHKHLPGLESSISISCAFSVWISQHGLQIDDARKILEDMVSPGSMAGHQFASQLMTELAKRVDDIIKHRASLAEQKRLRDIAAAAPVSTPETLELLDKLKQSVGVSLNVNDKRKPNPVG